MTVTKEKSKQDELVCPECGGGDIPWAINPIIRKYGTVCHNRGCKIKNRIITPIPRTEWEAKQTTKGKLLIGIDYSKDHDMAASTTTMKCGSCGVLNVIDCIQRVIDTNDEILVNRKLLGKILPIVEMVGGYYQHEETKELYAQLQALLEG